MSWASRRRSMYAISVIGFLVVLFGVPLAFWLDKPATCFDGKRNQGETSADRGGPCVLLDERSLLPHAILWARSFEVRDGTYNAVAYVENPNPEAGVREVNYIFGLYDAANILVAERQGTMFIMPGGVTPVFEGGIDTGNRKVARTYFEFTERLVWERMKGTKQDLVLRDQRAVDVGVAPRVIATVTNDAVTDFTDISFVTVVFDTAGNAIAASKTFLNSLAARETKEIIFTWPDPFLYVVGRLDILPILTPPPFE